MASATPEVKGFTRNELFPIIRKHALAVMTGADDCPRLAVNLMSSPGLGKSAFVADLHASLAPEVAKIIGCKPEDIPLVTVMAPLLDPMDGRGLPTTQGDGRKTKTYWARPGDGVLPPEEAPAAIWFVDEIDKGQLAVQNMLAQGLYENRIGEHAFPKRTFRISAMNLLSDRAGGIRMPSHLQNRLMHLPMCHELDAVLAHFAEREHDPMLLGFLKDRSNLLYTFNPKAENPAFATLRTWDEFGRHLKIQNPEHVHIWGSGLVGDGPTAEFSAYSQLYLSLPPWETLRAMTSKEAAAALKKAPPSAQYASISMVCANLKDVSDVDWMVETFEAVSADFCAAACNWATNIAKKYALTFKSKAFTKYSSTTGVKMYM